MWICEERKPRLTGLFEVRLEPVGGVLSVADEPDVHDVGVSGEVDHPLV